MPIFATAWGLLTSKFGWLIALGVAAAIAFCIWKWDANTIKNLRADNALLTHVNEENQKTITAMQVDEKKRQEADAILADARVKRATRVAKVKAILKNAPASENGPVPPLVQRFVDGLYEDGGSVPVH